jgi:hypothetical protein
MDSEVQVAVFPQFNTTVDIINVATSQVVQQHDAHGKIGSRASVQKNIAAIVMREPYHGIHVMNIKHGTLLCKFVLPDGGFPGVSLSKDTLSLAVGTDTGF